MEHSTVTDPKLVREATVGSTIAVCPRETALDSRLGIQGGGACCPPEIDAGRCFKLIPWGGEYALEIKALGIRKHASPDKSGSRKRAVLLAAFGRITAFSGNCDHQFYSTSSIDRVPPDSSGDAC